MYLRKAGTVILGISILMWAMTSFPRKTAFDRDYAAESASLRAEMIDGLDDVRPAYEQRSRDLGDARRAEELAYTVAGRIGHGLEPALRPLGFDWRIGTALVGAFAAKEVFVAQMGILFAVTDEDAGSEALRTRLRQAYSPLQAFCLLLFCLISAPCAATIACTWKESGSLKWAALQLLGLTVLAYVLTMAVYQIARLVT